MFFSLLLPMVCSLSSPPYAMAAPTAIGQVGLHVLVDLALSWKYWICYLGRCPGSCLRRLVGQIINVLIVSVTWITFAQFGTYEVRH
jgi:uncharacterized membrane protein